MDVGDEGASEGANPTDAAYEALLSLLEARQSSLKHLGLCATPGLVSRRANELRSAARARNEWQPGGFTLYLDMNTRPHKAVEEVLESDS
jgi:hypothetical protein